MARRNRNFDAISILKYSNKMKHVAEGVGGSEGTAELFAYEYAIGQGGYIALRKRVKEFLDRKGVQGAIRPSFYALAQTIFKLLVKEGVSKEDVGNNIDSYVGRYFINGTKAYDLAKKMVEDVFGVGAMSNKANETPAQIKEAEASATA